jgi:fermentation-respiration switch protein FrsA (DUF1100 family)
MVQKRASSTDKPSSKLNYATPALEKGLDVIELLATSAGSDCRGAGVATAGGRGDHGGDWRSDGQGLAGLLQWDALIQSA